MKLICSKTQPFAKADPMLYGHFLEHFHRQIYGGVYDPTSKFADEDGFRTDVIEALRRIKTPIIRWPGGCYVSAYDWHLGVGKNRVPSFDKAWRVEETNEFGTDEFIKLCKKLGCEPYICTNAGTGTAEEMSNWVEYCNLRDMGRFAKERIANGYEEPHKVKYWSIGNENYGVWEIGAKDAEEWAKLVRESAKMMLHVDPKIEISAASILDLDWNINLLQKAGKFLDWLSIHHYAEHTAGGAPSVGYDRQMLRTGDDLEGLIDRVRAYLIATGLEKRIKIAFDEWNLRGWYHPFAPDVLDVERQCEDSEDFYRNKLLAARDKNDLNETYTMADAVFSATFLNICLRNCDIVKMACFSPVVNTRGAIYTYDDGLVLRPTYFVFELYANLLKDTVLKSWSEDVPTLTGEDEDKIKTVNAVDAVVTYGDGMYAIAACNKDPNNAHKLALDMLGDDCKEMRIHTLNGPSQESYNDIDRTEVGVITTEWMPYTGEITLEPHSVNVIEVK